MQFFLYNICNYLCTNNLLCQRRQPSNVAKNYGLYDQLDYFL